MHESPDRKNPAAKRGEPVGTPPHSPRRRPGLGSGCGELDRGGLPGAGGTLPSTRAGPDGGAGATSLLLGIGPALHADAVASTAERTATLLTVAGYPPIVTDQPVADGPSVIEVRYPGEGADAAGFGITFGVGTNESALDGQARCVPGDADEIKGSR